MTTIITITMTTTSIITTTTGATMVTTWEGNAEVQQRWSTFNAYTVYILLLTLPYTSSNGKIITKTRR